MYLKNDEIYDIFCECVIFILTFYYKFFYFFKEGEKYVW